MSKLLILGAFAILAGAFVLIAQMYRHLEVDGIAVNSEERAEDRSGLFGEFYDFRDTVIESYRAKRAGWNWASAAMIGIGIGTAIFS